MGLHDTVEKVLALHAKMQALGERVEAASRQFERAKEKMYLQQKYADELVEHLERLRRGQTWDRLVVGAIAGTVGGGIVAWALFWLLGR